jgi:DNA-binding beta-propeller fold protein YncE
MVLRPQAERAAAEYVWPPAPGEVPRYAYLGQLLGEQNLVASESASARDGMARALAWLVGLGRSREPPVVLQRPQGGAVDADGRIYVADVSRQAVFVFDEAGGRMEVWDEATEGRLFRSPIGVAMGPGGEVLVSDPELGAVFRLDREGRPLGAIGEGRLERPTGVAWDPETARLYVADTRGNDVKVFDAAGTLVGRLGGAGEEPGQLNGPTYLAVAGDRVYVSDTLNSRVQVFDREGRLLERFGERGLYVGNLARPKGVTVDAEGNIYVVESYFDYLLVFDPEGRLLLPIGGSGNQPGQFFQPTGVWTDRRNRVFVSDMLNGRVEIFQFLGGS